MRRKGFSLIELLVVIAIIAILAAILFPIFLRAKEASKIASCNSNLRQLGVSFRMYQEDFNGCYPACSRMPGEPWGYASWASWIMPYVKNKTVFACPGAVNNWNAEPYTRKTPDGRELTKGILEKLGYGYNEYLNYIRGGVYGPFRTESSLQYPSQVLMLADCYVQPLVGDWNDQNNDLGMNDMDGLPATMNRIRYADGRYKNQLTGKPQVRHSGPNVLFCDGHIAHVAINKFKAVDYPGYLKPDTCAEWPIIYPKAKSLLR